ncbi:Gfo/Idh/MocA family oxidoreductase [Streptosporangium sp. NPDC006930]|uniref:Gfo/Idh/MocA family protein n=1 Tax=Streptosporangium sp. NPDC006930 TaxID=3154783 RepID=UPI003445C15A
MSRPGLRWGIAGYGDIVRRKALPALLSLGETVTCVWGRDATRARAICEEFGFSPGGSGAFGTSDYTELLDAAEVVYVATPVAAHLPLAIAAARAGLPVLVEKPLGGAAPELAGAHAGVAYYRRLAPALGCVREILRGRAVHRAIVEFSSPFDPGPDDPRLWRTDPALSGGGVLADVGSHRLDLLCWLLGEPAVTAAWTGRPFDLGAERLARVELAWPSGTTAGLEAAWRPGARHDRLRLFFDGGHLELDPLDSGTVRGIVGGVAVDEFLPPPPNPHLPLMADFARSVRNGTDPVCTVRDADTVDRLIATAYAIATPLEEHP